LAIVSRPDLAFVSHSLAKVAHDPSEEHVAPSTTDKPKQVQHTTYVRQQMQALATKLTLSENHSK
jgi:hypothetical protein